MVMFNPSEPWPGVMTAAGVLDLIVEMESLRGFTTFLLLSAGGQHGDQLGGVDVTLVVNVHLVVSLVDFVGGELVAPGHEGVPEPFRIDLSLFIEGLEGVDNDVIFVRAAGHAVGEQSQELSEVDGARSLTDHLIELLLGREPAQGVEGGAQVVLADDAILVVIH